MLFGQITSAPVYLVDDDALVRESTAFLLGTMDISCRTFADGAGFLDVVRDLPDGCLLIDQVMPGISGSQVIRRLRALRRTMPIILMTAATDASRRRLDETIGAHTVLEKPFEEGALLTALGSGFEMLAFGSDGDATNARALVAALTPLQTLILRGWIAGMDTPALARRLGLTESIVRRNHVALKERIAARDVQHAIVIGKRAGMRPWQPPHDRETPVRC